ncbi:MAG: hypothetical protein ABIH04_07245 [Planctomycetota bacterium]
MKRENSHSSKTAKTSRPRGKSDENKKEVRAIIKKHKKAWEKLSD